MFTMSNFNRNKDAIVYSFIDKRFDYHAYWKWYCEELNLVQIDAIINEKNDYTNY